MNEADIELWARRLLTAFDSVTSLDPISDQTDFSIDDAYHVSAHNMGKRVARNERVIGWKIGFTNRTIWDEYDVHAPIWGPMYDTTVGTYDPAGGAIAWPVGHLHEPRIEPEIAFRMTATPTPDMDEAALLDCIDAVAHGFEIVQSPFVGWRFAAADTIAVGALHGNYVRGPWVEVGDRRDTWLEMLRTFSITLRSSEGVEDQGFARNVLDGPLSAVRHFVAGLAERPFARAILPGDIITTGTVTRAFPVHPGQMWWTEVEGLPLPEMRIVVTE